MAHGIHTLTQGQILAFIKKCLKAKKTKVLCDGGGLYLRVVGAAGSMSWTHRFELDGQRHEKGLGSFHTFSLAEARERARLCRQLLADGKDPIAEARAIRTAWLKGSTAMPSKTFKFCAMQYIAFKEPSWSSDKHRRDWEGSLRQYVFPSIGSKLVSMITQEDVLKVLQPKWAEHTETLKRTRARIEMVIDWAIGQKLRAAADGNPARWKGGIAAYLNASVRKPTQNFAALPYSELPKLASLLMCTPPGAVQPDMASDALLFCLLTAARSREVRFATWQELDMTTGVWAIAGSRMKSKKMHRVPLSELLIALLRRQPTFPQPGMTRDGFVFRDSRGTRAMPEGAMRGRLQGLYPEASVHGTCRAGFSTWAADVAKAPSEIRESALAHSVDAVVGAYQRSDHLAERRDLMLAWESFVTAPPSDRSAPALHVVA